MVHSTYLITDTYIIVMPNGIVLGTLVTQTPYGLSLKTGNGDGIFLHLVGDWPSFAEYVFCSCDFYN